MQNVLRKLPSVGVVCMLLSSMPGAVPSSQARPLACLQANCIYIPVVHMPPYLTSGYWRLTNGFIGEYIIYGEIENNSPFPIDHIVLNSGVLQFTTESKVVLPGQLARYVAIFPLPRPELPPTKPTPYTWTVNTATQFQPLDVLTIATREQRDEFGSYTAMTATLRNSSVSMLQDIDVQVWAYQLFDGNLCSRCVQSYTQTVLLPQEIVTIASRWRLVGYFPPTEVHATDVHVAGYGVISP